MTIKKRGLTPFILAVLFFTVCSAAAGATILQEKYAVDFNQVNCIIKKYAQTFPGTLGVAVKDLHTGGMTHYNGGMSFPSASIVKLPILVEYVCQIEEGKIKPDDKMALENHYKVGGSGILKNKPAGIKYKLEILCSYMITISDNTATDMLIHKLGMKNIEKRIKAIGLKNTTLKRTIYDFGAMDNGYDNLATPLDMCRLLSSIYYEKIPSSSGSKIILDMLKEQKRNHLIPANLPAGTVVAHKTGQLELLGVLGDVGIIYPAKGETHPYILCLLAKNITNTEKAEKAFSGISIDIFNEFNKGGINP